MIGVGTHALLGLWGHNQARWGKQGYVCEPQSPELNDEHQADPTQGAPTFAHLPVVLKDVQEWRCHVCVPLWWWAVSLRSETQLSVHAVDTGAGAYFPHFAWLWPLRPSLKQALCPRALTARTCQYPREISDRHSASRTARSRARPAGLSASLHSRAFMFDRPFWALGEAALWRLVSGAWAGPSSSCLCRSVGTLGTQHASSHALGASTPESRYGAGGTRQVHL